MRDFLTRLREKPEKTRRKIMYAVITVVGVLVFALWIGSFFVQLSITDIDRAIIALMSREDQTHERREEGLEESEVNLATPYFVISHEIEENTPLKRGE
jgi:hypothetical protein